MRQLQASTRRGFEGLEGGTLTETAHSGGTERARCVSKAAFADQCVNPSSGMVSALWSCQSRAAAFRTLWELKSKGPRENGCRGKSVGRALAQLEL